MIEDDLPPQIIIARSAAEQARKLADYAIRRDDPLKAAFLRSVAEEHERLGALPDLALPLV